MSKHEWTLEVSMARGTRWMTTVLLALLVIPLSGCGGCKSRSPAEQPAEKPSENEPGTAKAAPPPAYLPVGEAVLREFEAGTEYTISGRVTNEMMEPLAGATVAAYATPLRWTPPAFEQPAPVDTQVCDDSGNYVIRLRMPANLWITIKMEGYGPAVSFLPVRDTRQTIRDFQLQAAGAMLSGIVSDKKDRPIPGIMVIANIPPFTLLADNVVPMPVAQITDAAGKFTFDGLPIGDASLVAGARGYAEQEALSPLKRGVNDLVNFGLPAAPPISFMVKNSRGDAIPSAAATAPGYFKLAAADRRGNIEVSVPTEVGVFDCTIAAEGYQSTTIQLDPKAPPASVVLEDRPVLKGRVAAETGGAVSGALVNVFGTGGAQGKFDRAVVTDKTGGFELALAHPPVREIRVSRTGYFDQRIVFDKSKPAPPEVAVRMKQVETGLYGRVIDYRGIPVKRFILHLKNTKGGGKDFQRSFSSGNGKYMVTDVQPGTYDLIIQSVADSTAEDVQLVRLDQLEIRKGFLVGEVVSQLPKPRFGK
jgi:hypothetical protein